jgi:ribosomal protein L11 methyltransferase
MDVGDDSWKMSLPCTRAEAAAIGANDDALESFPVLLTREPDPADPESWLIETYLDEEPDAARIAAFRSLAPSARRLSPVIEHLPPDDWLALSQSGLEPVRAGRFYVYTAARSEAVPEGTIAFQIEASRAFGTGQHQTTSGCLLTLDGLKQSGARFRSIADIGTGTGLLAFAAHRLWPAASVIASDIDPVAIEISLENAALNGIRVGAQAGAVELVTAAGMLHRRLRRRVPYDLIIANILAGPLIDLAPVLSTALAPGGTLILAGLLDHQAEAVANAYRNQGLRLAGSITRDEWPSLRLVKRKRVGIRRPG